MIVYTAETAFIQGVDLYAEQSRRIRAGYEYNLRLQSGWTVLVDEAYIRDSIVNPHGTLVEGYPPIMPTFQGLISEEGLLQLTAYIKSLSPAAAPGAVTPMPAAAAAERKPAKP